MEPAWLEKNLFNTQLGRSPKMRENSQKSSIFKGRLHYEFGDIA